MRGKFGADGAEALSATGAGDARLKALALISAALGHLDSDCSISPIIGAYLQSAIDALWISASNDRSSIQLH